MDKMDKPFAAFVLASLPGRLGLLYAATTREGGGIGLPGGKVEPGEKPVDAAVREAAEEGWVVEVTDPQPIQSKQVDGRLVVWFAGRVVRELDDWKERYRGISPVAVPGDQVLTSGFGNETLPIPMAYD